METIRKEVERQVAELRLKYEAYNAVLFDEILNANIDVLERLKTV